MTNKDILEYAVKHQSNLVLCDDYAGETEFTDSLIDKMCEEKNAVFFEDEYVKYFTRVESMGVGFLKPGAATYEEGIDFEKLKKVHSVTHILSETARNNMIDNIRSFRVLPNNTRPTNSKSWKISCQRKREKTTFLSVEQSWLGMSR